MVGNSPEPVHAVILDHMFHVGDRDVLEALAADARTRGVPVILHSAVDETVLHARAKLHPRCQVVPKTGHMRPLAEVLDALAPIVDETSWVDMFR